MSKFIDICNIMDGLKRGQVITVAVAPRLSRPMATNNNKLHLSMETTHVKQDLPRNK